MARHVVNSIEGFPIKRGKTIDLHIYKPTFECIDALVSDEGPSLHSKMVHVIVDSTNLTQEDVLDLEIVELNLLSGAIISGDASRYVEYLNTAEFNDFAKSMGVEIGEI